MNKVLLLLALFIQCLSTFVCATEVYDGRHGWPVQRAPARVIVCNNQALSSTEKILLESLSGLAAQAVNEGRSDEMVWIETGSESYRQILESSLDALGITTVGHMDVWQLLSHLRKKKIVKGYILYRMDTSEGELYTRRADMDVSCNVATVYAALLRGVLIDETLEAHASRAGLRKLKDARRETMSECFARNSSKLNNCSALSIDPRVSNCRDIAIGHKLMVYYDTDELSARVLEWVKPLSPILGWNCGDEDEYTGAITRWGHYNTASNWCHNLPLVMAASDRMEPLVLPDADFDDMAAGDTLSYHSFVMSDGDNMQWTMGNFIDTPLYFGNTDGNHTPVSWTLCPVNLSVVSTSTWNRLVEARNDNSTFIEYGGGYQYPDEFAVNRSNRTELLTEFARRMNWHFNKLNLRVFGFICKNIFSDEARQAYEIYAREIDKLTGMIAVQYDPYNAGGDIVWVKNRRGEDIPVSTARYAVWADLFSLPTRGAPDYIATHINRDAAEAAVRGSRRLSWTIIHAWSDFATTTVSRHQPQKGYNTVKLANEMLSPLVKNVSLEELLLIIRNRNKNLENTTKDEEKN